MSFNVLKIPKGDTAELRYQLKEDGAAKDITGMTFKFSVKENLSDAAHKIGPVAGTIDDAALGKFSFELTPTETNQATFKGLYSVAMFDGAARTTLTPAGGVEFRLVEDITT
jgi:hypothetical protein